MEFKKHILSNGLTIIGELNEAAKSAAVGFFVKTGARDETMQINGVSHFLEHMLFKGTDQLSAQGVNEAFDSTGADFNAFTSEENTVYYASVMPEYLLTITDIWAQLLRPALRDDDFNIEKNVIKEEISMYEDMPSFDVMDRCRSLHFDKHPCGMSVLGSRESIDAMTSSQMRDYFYQRYSPNNIVAGFTGNFDWNALVGLLTAKCSDWQTRDAGRMTSHYQGSCKKERFTKTSIVGEHICSLSAAPSIQSKDRFAAALLGSIIGDDTGSRFFWEIVDKALAETAVMQFAPMDGTGAFYVYVKCAAEKANVVKKIIEQVLEKVKQDGVEERELQTAKNKALSELVLKNEVPRGRLLDLGFNWMYLGQYRNVEDDVQAIKNVTVEEIAMLLEKYDITKFTEFSMGPSQKEKA